ncbi:MAG: amidohydrolase family protein [Candidatus Brocadiae bacterium]|nr:amidohydrolase family protein [Candidatus Brocadiia bacterium]
MIETKELLIQGGLFVTSEKRWTGDLLIQDGKIARLGQNIKPSTSCRTIPAKGFEVLPGGIDPHTHLLPPFVDDYFTGSRAALAGGITTIGCMVYGKEGEGLLAVLQQQEKLLQEMAIADMFFHPYVWNSLDKAQRELEDLQKIGQSSIKIFLLVEDFEKNKQAYQSLIQEASRLGLITLAHCEDACLLEKACQDLEAINHTSLQYYAYSRPVESEVKAVEDALEMARQTNSKIYLVHISSQKALDVCLRARNQGVQVFVETRPIYLYFTKERYLQKDGPLYVGQPPLRQKEDTEALWDALKKGHIDTLGSDHAPWKEEQKMNPDLNIRDLRPGVSDLQTMLPVFYSEGVLKNRISLEQFVALTSTNAAKIFGFFPQKGTIAEGADADLVLWNPSEKRTLHKEDLLSASDFSLHENWEIQGWPQMTIRRGEIVYENKKLLGVKGTGKWLKKASSRL